jgi:hypothetical protein
MQGPPSTSLVFVACAFKDPAATESAVKELLASGVDAADIGLGGLGVQAQQAKALAAELGVRPDIDPEDPLAGAPGLASAARGAVAIDRGGIIGGLIGAVTGLVVGFIPGIHLVPTSLSNHVLADALLLFILGALAGATLGGAFAPQRSSHTGFRIVDELEHGALAVVASLDAARAADVTQLLNAAGGLHVLRVPEE